MSKPVSGRYVSFAEREEIALRSVQGREVRENARRIGRSPSMVSRELTRNTAPRGSVSHIVRRPRNGKRSGSLNDPGRRSGRLTDGCVNMYGSA